MAPVANPGHQYTLHLKRIRNDYNSEILQIYKFHNI